MCGCGSKGGFFNPPEFVFHGDCCTHDMLYDLGGTEADRKRADDAFYAAMKQSAGRDPAWRLAAWVYYRAVRQFGKTHFSYKG